LKEIETMYAEGLPEPTRWLQNEDKN
jgi:hypothetical protein